MRSICVFSFMACFALSTAHAATIMYAGNGGHTPDQVANGAPPSANNGGLVTVNESTGVVTLVGQPTGVSRLGGLAFAPGGVLYGSTINGNNSYPPTGPAAQTSDLVQINPSNGALITDIGTIKANGTPLEMADLADQPGTGVLFGITAGSNTNAPGLLYTINTKTGAATLVGGPGDFFDAIAFAPNGTLYLLSADLDQTGTPVNPALKTLNPLTGATLSTLPIAFSAPFAPFGAFGIDPTTGVLWAGNGDVGGLYTINPTTGAETLVANTTPNFFGDIDFEVVPEPVASGLCILGLFGIVAYRRLRRPASIS